MSNEDAILQVIHVSKTFHRNKETAEAVRDITFSLNRGEILGIFGVSGSGKSTTGRLITGQLLPDEGQVLFHGTIISGHQKRNHTGKIQMVFQSPYASFDPRRTLGYSISESFLNHGLSKMQAQEKTSQLLEECLLPAAYCMKYPDEVSGGECQRAAIARALASAPEILVCDESVSALDGPAARQILLLYQRLRADRNLSIIFISHNLAMVQYLCKRMLVMEKGSIIEEGTPDQIIRHPSSSYTRALIAAADYD